MICIQSDTLLLADVFENFRNMSIEVYQLDLAHFLFAPGLAWQACLKKTAVKLELLTNPDMLLMVEKGIRGRISHATHRGAKANIKYMKNYNKDEKESFYNTMMLITFMDLQCQNHYQLMVLNGWKIYLKYMKISQKNYDKDSDKGYIIDEDV